MMYKSQFRKIDTYCQDCGLFCVCITPHVFPVTQFLPLVDCSFDSRCVSSSSLIVLSLKALVFVGPWIVFPACDQCYLLDYIKLSLCEFLVPDSLLQRTWQTLKSWISPIIFFGGAI